MKWRAFLKDRIEAHPINISCVAHMFGIKPRTLYNWYKFQLCGYPEKVKSGSWGEKTIKIADSSTGEVIKEKPVYIAKSENVGAKMTIDEKMIGKKMYTVMTNLTSGKIAFIAQSQNGEEIKQAVTSYLSDRLQEVTSVSSDMNATYKRISKELFPNACVVVDKFHVISHVLDALQQVRKSIKTWIINEGQENSQTEKAPIKDLSELEYLERARYILFKRSYNWEEEEKAIIDYLVMRYPILDTAVTLTEKIRNWYDKRHVGKDLDYVERDLYDWLDDVVIAKIPAFTAIRKMFEKHFEDIVNYFKEGQTNAKAENMNGKIQRFMANNFGIRDRSFFFFRLAGYFS